MRVPAQTIIVFSHIANFRVKIELNNNRASTRHWNPSAAWNYVPWKITGEHFNSQNSHWPSQGHQLQWFHGFYPQDLPWLQGFSSHPDGNSRRYLKPQIPGIWGCGYSISLRWKQSKTGSFWGFFCTYLLVFIPQFPQSCLSENCFSSFTLQELVKTRAHPWIFFLLCSAQKF